LQCNVSTKENIVGFDFRIGIIPILTTKVTVEKNHENIIVETCHGDCVELYIIKPN